MFIIYDIRNNRPFVGQKSRIIVYDSIDHLKEDPEALFVLNFPEYEIRYLTRLGKIKYDR